MVLGRTTWSLLLALSACSADDQLALLPNDFTLAFLLIEVGGELKPGAKLTRDSGAYETHIAENESLLLLTLDGQALEELGQIHHAFSTTPIESIELLFDVEPGCESRGRLLEAGRFVESTLPPSAQLYRLDEASQWSAQPLSGPLARLGFRQAVTSNPCDRGEKLRNFSSQLRLLPDQTVIDGKPRSRGNGDDSDWLNTDGGIRVSDDRVVLWTNRALHSFERGRAFVDTPEHRSVTSTSAEFDARYLYSRETGRLVNVRTDLINIRGKMVEFEVTADPLRYVRETETFDWRILDFFFDDALGARVVGAGGRISTSSTAFGRYQTRQVGAAVLHRLVRYGTGFAVGTDSSSLMLLDESIAPSAREVVELGTVLERPPQLVRALATIGNDLWVSGHPDPVVGSVSVARRDPSGQWTEFVAELPLDAGKCGKATTCGRVEAQAIREIHPEPETPATNPRLYLVLEQCPLIVALEPVFGCSVTVAPAARDETPDLTEAYGEPHRLTVFGKSAAVLELDL